MQEETGRGVLAAVSGIGAWLIPAWGCPVCLSAFAGTMSAFGFGFMATEEVLTPLTGVLLGGSLLALGFSARRRRRFEALAVGVIAGGFIVASKFYPAQVWLSYVGLVGLLVAAIWNMRVAGRPPIFAATEGKSVPIQASMGRDGDEANS